jgi:excisionase family DNA binding protein
MNPQEGGRLAEGRGNGGVDLERSHSASTVPHAAPPMPSARDAEAGMGVDLSAHRLLYNVRDVARMLSLSRAQVYREIQRGALVTVSIGRCRRVSRAALETYVAHLEEGSAR